MFSLIRLISWNHGSLMRVSFEFSTIILRFIAIPISWHHAAHANMNFSHDDNSLKCFSGNHGKVKELSVYIYATPINPV